VQKVMNYISVFLLALRTILYAKPKPTPPDLRDGTVLAPPWYVIAFREIGVKEYPVGDNGKIIEYHQYTSLKAKDQKTSWCASFVCWCFEQAGVESTNSAWAKSYLNWGVKLDRPKLGCVVVLSRGPVSGHVGFFVDDTAKGIVLLSGNTANSVCISTFDSSRVLGYRWPSERR